MNVILTGVSFVKIGKDKKEINDGSFMEKWKIQAVGRQILRNK